RETTRDAATAIEEQPHVVSLVQVSSAASLAAQGDGAGAESRQASALHAGAATVSAALRAPTPATLSISGMSSMIAPRMRTLTIDETPRSEERRVGKECRCRRWRYD